jgi:hypothetical protein
MLRYLRVHTAGKVDVDFQKENFTLDYTVELLVADTGVTTVLDVGQIQELFARLSNKCLDNTLKRATLENITRLMALRVYRYLKNTPYLLTLNVKIDGGSRTYVEVEFNAEEVLIHTGGTNDGA